MNVNETIPAVKALKAHLALNVRSVEQSTEFYRKLFGIEPAKVRRRYAKFDVANPPLNLTLNEVSFGEQGALSHLGIQVSSTADVLAMREKWAASGLYTRDEMQTNCCYAIQDKTWVRDPDGNEWEAFVVLEDNLSETQMCGDEDVPSCAAGSTDEAGQHPSAGSASVGAAAPAVECCGMTAPVDIRR
ncbi:MAG: ArsI/CadI family heavy metal resistance metalloenzyme [Pyrinomonadaceae bacterium]